MDSAKFDTDFFEDHLFKICTSESFQKCEGIIGEVPFFIAPYPVMKSVQVLERIKRLDVRLKKSGVKILTLSLYDLMIEMLEENQLLKRIIDDESAIEEDSLREVLNNITDPELNFVDHIASKLANEDFDVLFVKDSGMMHPYFRLHTLLNSLQSVAEGFPSIFFFSGTYVQSDKGSYLSLFGRLKSENYYRAFNILERVV